VFCYGVSCQNKIEKKLRNTAGVKNAKVNYSAGTADITYDADIISLKELSAVIEKLGYRVLTGNEKEVPKTGRIIGILIIIIALYVILQQLVCQNCGNKFTMDRMEVKSGGCNPRPIFAKNKTVTDETITISYNFLNEARQIFANWKTSY